MFDFLDKMFDMNHDGKLGVEEEEKIEVWNGGTT